MFKFCRSVPQPEGRQTKMIWEPAWLVCISQASALAKSLSVYLEKLHAAFWEKKEVLYRASPSIRQFQLHPYNSATHHIHHNIQSRHVMDTNEDDSAT